MEYILRLLLEVYGRVNVRHVHWLYRYSFPLDKAFLADGEQREQRRFVVERHVPCRGDWIDEKKVVIAISVGGRSSISLTNDNDNGNDNNNCVDS